MEDLLIVNTFAPFGLSPSPALRARIGDYVSLLLRWNERINLTAIVEPREILSRHFGESMFGARLIPQGAGRLVDVGSGAGFPGLALKLMRPELAVTLVEPNKKKAAFLAEACRVLQVQQVQVLAEPFEQLEANDLYDVVTTRALRLDVRLIQWSASALTTRGRLMAWVGAQDAARAARASLALCWQAAVPIPASSGRVILVGERQSP